MITNTTASPMTHSESSHANSLLLAVRQWQQTLGMQAVAADIITLERYARTTLPTRSMPGAVLYPINTTQVQAIVKIASLHGVSLHPISRGRNYGYGNACPATNGQVIIDLQRMNRIISVDDELAYTVIEPGVTQGQLFEYLQGHHPDLWMDATGAGLEASIVGNALDRGFGHTPCGDHFGATCGLQLVLADGNMLETGFGHYAAHATHCYPYGIGPVLDGLFSQSNLGIVTRAGIWLNRKPQAFEAFFVKAKSAQALASLTDRLRELRLSGLVTSAVHIANDLRVMSSRISHPMASDERGQMLDNETRQQLGRKLGIGHWNVSGAIYGSHTTMGAMRKAIRRTLRPFHVAFLSDRKLALAKLATRSLRTIGPVRRLSKTLQVIEPIYQLLKGQPTDAFLPSIAWHMPQHGTVGTTDPLDRSVGLIWVSPVAPAQGQHGDTLVHLMEPIFNKHGFDMPITMTLVTDRALCVVSNISFDRKNPGQVERAQHCYDELMQTLLNSGYPPYRTGPGGFEKLRANDSSFWSTCRRIKQSLDPDAIISPGRYVA